MAKDNTFNFIFNRFYQGASPTAHLSNLTSFGNAGHYSVASNIDVVSNPDCITQGPTLSTLTSGDQDGAVGGASTVDELINFIMDKAVADDETYGIGVTKLFKISSTEVASGGSPSWPQAITSCADGQSVIDLKGNLYGFYNKSSGGDILKMPIATEVIDPNWGSDTGEDGPTGAAALQEAIHPVAAKEDLMLFGNGKYLGVYTDETTTIEPTKLDFGNGTEVADIIFHANQWWIVVNSGVSGTNRTIGHIYLYDGAATTTLLSDETSVGVQRIGFLYALNGIVYVAYQDLSSSGGFQIGYIFGRQIKPLVYFTGTLPTFAQKTLYKNTILFISSGSIYSAGAIIGKLPFQISQLADGGHATIGGLAAPFGTPMVASTDGISKYKIAKFSGYDTTACNWKSIIIPLVSSRAIGYIDEVVVLTKTLAGGDGEEARCDLLLEYNQGSSNSGTAKQITGTGSRRFVFGFGSGPIEDFRVYLNWAEGNVTNDCPIREIQVNGHFVER